MNRIRQLLTIAVLATIASACASGPTRYLHPNADLGAIKKVAVLPFENVSGVAGSSDKVHKLFLVELLSLEIFDVVEPGAVSKVIRGETAGTPDQLTPDDLKRIGKALGADGLFMGQIVDYQDPRGAAGGGPEITLQFRLVEVTSGATIWSTSETRAGVKVSTRLFGVSGDSITEATRKVIQRQLATLLK
ncbi:MAG: hypothetical protein JJE51_12770 [Thermoanaerobaculia bacterium]|nr:hypothetical protein [Thermoanaerobaculia bacterium]